MPLATWQGAAGLAIEKQKALAQSMKGDGIVHSTYEEQLSALPKGMFDKARHALQELHNAQQQKWGELAGVARHSTISISHGQSQIYLSYAMARNRLPKAKSRWAHTPSGRASLALVARRSTTMALSSTNIPSSSTRRANLTANLPKKCWPRRNDGDKPRAEPNLFELCRGEPSTAVGEQYLERYRAFVTFLKTGDKGWLNIHLPTLALTMRCYYKACSQLTQLTPIEGGKQQAALLKVTLREPISSF